ncbi:Abi family protein [Oceanospirillum linum]|uniref:Abortive phage resistance protein n=1 Tax=Oceanospirillum linum TaxID=966 RepID=A0A1T1HB87_OCELI|nr:Abi family protein [Oceanospirillum linum]OOV87095.1 abortive phage resistance protein [Oceanospirillum linum]SEF74267.1 Abortive infection bacteriophage resistance protein [Oleiphilus messinensis]SMP16763.1 Abortive infection bacteriophage resistance protein [Oceanospirillum linum]
MTNKLKPWKSLDEQLALLVNRGMQVDNPAAAKSYLERLGYYRLSGYWYPFRAINSTYSPNTPEPQRTDLFIEGSHFADVVMLYVFDKKLRLLAMDALERIEMAVRVDISHLLGKTDPYAHENPKCLHGHFSKKIQKRGPAKGRTEHELWLEKYRSHLWRSRREPFVEHYQSIYKRLPIWVAVEVWDFGMMSKLYAGMKIADKDIIAQKYGAPDGNTFTSWLRSLNFIRNISAHHSRLWNINVLERSPTPSGADYWQELNNARPFFYFCLMQRMLQVICPGSSWYQRLADLITEFPSPNTNAISIEDFGVRQGWQAWSLCPQK